MEDFNAEIARRGPLRLRSGSRAKSRIGEPVEPSALVFLMTAPSTNAVNTAPSTVLREPGQVQDR